MLDVVRAATDKASSTATQLRFLRAGRDVPLPLPGGPPARRRASVLGSPVDAARLRRESIRPPATSSAISARRRRAALYCTHPLKTRGGLTGQGVLAGATPSQRFSAGTSGLLDVAPRSATIALINALATRDIRHVVGNARS